MTSDPTRSRLSGTSGGPDDPPGRDENDRERFAAVRSYADRVLETGRDRWSGEETPLFADGVHADTHDPAVWRHDGESFVVSNLASQQNLFRTLTAVSVLTGDATYEDAARRRSPTTSNTWPTRGACSGGAATSSSTS